MTFQQAALYLRIPESYCRWIGGLRWAHYGDAVEFLEGPASGRTFAFAAEIALFMEGFRGHGGGRSRVRSRVALALLDRAGGPVRISTGADREMPGTDCRPVSPGGMPAAECRAHCAASLRGCASGGRSAGAGRDPRNPHRRATGFRRSCWLKPMTRSDAGGRGAGSRSRAIRSTGPPAA